MARKREAPEVVMRVSYVVDPENARAAQDILAEGLRRALTRAIHEKRQRDMTAEVG